MAKKVEKGKIENFRFFLLQVRLTKCKYFCFPSTVFEMTRCLNNIIKLSTGFSSQKAKLQFFMELNMYLLLKKVKSLILRMTKPTTQAASITFLRLQLQCLQPTKVM